MSYAALETSGNASQPIELYAFQTADEGWFYTSGDAAVTYLGQLYTPEAILRTAINQSGEAKAGQLKITIPGANPVPSAFKSYTPDSPMSIVIYRTHGADGEFVVIFTGRVLVAAFGDFAELTCMPENDLLKYNVPSQQYQAQCNHFLFDAGCKVAPVSYSVAGAVTALAVAVLTVPACAAKPDGWFNAGYVQFGEQRRMVLFHVGNQLTLIGPISGLTVGATVIVYAGCMRDYGTCVSKFNNAKNFAGFPWIPVNNPFGTPFV
jgi:uncharacterized phage protein (TIGR02218 family)